MDVAEVAGVTPQTVSATMNGYRHSPRVLNALRSFGIPERLLYDPRRAESAA
nr:LacI family DNA-binding transcriptional regulator [uncultured Desulfovibrio sp.]